MNRPPIAYGTILYSRAKIIESILKAFEGL